MTAEVLAVIVTALCAVLALATIVVGVTLRLQGYREGRVLMVYGTSVAVLVTGFVLVTSLHLTIPF